MTSAAVAVVERWRDAYARQDWPAAYATMHPDVEILEAASLPYGGLWKGHEQARELNRRVRAQWAELPLAADRARLFDLGESDRGRVVLLVDEIISALTTGGAVRRLPLVELLFVREGRIGEIRVFYFDTRSVWDGSAWDGSLRGGPAEDLSRRPPRLVGPPAAPELETMERYRRLCAARDVDGLRTVLAADILVEEAETLPYGGHYRGHAGYVDLFERVSRCWEHLPLQDGVEQTVVAGPDAAGTLVVVLDRIHSRVAGTGVVLDMPLVELLWLREGRIAAIRPYYFDTLAIAAAAGG